MITTRILDNEGETRTGRLFLVWFCTSICLSRERERKRDMLTMSWLKGIATTQHDTRKCPSLQFATRGNGFEDPIIIIASKTAAVVVEVRRSATVPLFWCYLRVLQYIIVTRTTFIFMLIEDNVIYTTSCINENWICRVQLELEIKLTCWMSRILFEKSD